MFQKEWPILLVDDEPDVLAISKLAMKDFRVDGVPLKLYTATSKAEAIQLLSTSLGREVAPYIAVAFIDVVMETDQAGLELCEYLRDTLKNKATQIYVRTGQPGVAPERAVIDRYDINGYFSKVETTEDKLYSLVKAGVRQHEFITGTLLLFKMLTAAIGRSESKEDIRQVMAGFAQGLRRNCLGEELEQVEHQLAIVLGDEVFVAMGIEPAQAVAECRRLDQLEGVPLDGSGDKVVYEGKTLLFTCAASSTNGVAYMLYKDVELPSQSRVLADAYFLKAIATLVTQTARGSRVATVA